MHTDQFGETFLGYARLEARVPDVSPDKSKNLTPTGFFKINVLNDYAGFPTARIVSPTNGQTVSGTVKLLVSAQDDSQLFTVNLYLDDALIACIDAGDLQIDLDTTHFTNGTHALYVTARDNGDNVTQSAAVALDFENVVRWPDAGALFETFVPINVESDLFPADWTVFVETGGGVTVRTFSGSTSDGLIQTNWDGLDNNGVPAPDETAYLVTVVVTSNSGSSAMMASAGFEINLNEALSSAKVNRYGVMDYEVEEAVPDATAMYYETFKTYLEMPESEKAEFMPVGSDF